jgi:hypothetical protein
MRRSHESAFASRVDGVEQAVGHVHCSLAIILQEFFFYAAASEACVVLASMTAAATACSHSPRLIDYSCSTR